MLQSLPVSMVTCTRVTSQNNTPDGWPLLNSIRYEEMELMQVFSVNCNVKPSITIKCTQCKNDQNLGLNVGM